MKKRVSFAAAITLAALTIGISYGTGSSSAASPTFTKDVAPILFRNCASCHRPGDIGPMSLLTYENARPWAKAIRENVAAGTMPPWHAEAPRGIFSNDRRLSDKDRETVIKWVDAGAPRGNPSDLPPAPQFNDGWEIGRPDAIFSMAKEFEVPAEGTIPYHFVMVPTNLTEDKWVQAIEILPGAKKVVHHVLVFCREPGEPRSSGFVPVIPAAGGSAARREQSLPGALIATTAPGTNAMVFQPGTALRVKAGSTLMFQMHYTSNGTATKDLTRVGMIFAKEPPKQEIRTSAFVNATFVLPPGSTDQKVDSGIEFTEDVTLWGIFPHTHLRGKSWQYSLIYPDGRSEVVLSVPKYDFNWQTYYLFTKPLQVPKRARLLASAVYDNSPSNKWNPDPTKAVRWGPQTWEEMQYSGITYSSNGAKP